jgi:hypothetical protein
MRNVFFAKLAPNGKSELFALKGKLRVYTRFVSARVEPNPFLRDEKRRSSRVK